MKKTLYKIDSKGKERFWTLVVEGDSTWTISGLLEGKSVTSKPKKWQASNVGRSNEKSAEEVALDRFNKMFKDKQEQGDYRDSLEVASQTHALSAFKPTLADRYDRRKDKVTFPVIASPKLDGMRCIVDINGMWSRANKPIKSAPHIYEALKPVFEMHPNAKFDGELYNHKYKDNFEKIISLAKKSKPTEEDLKESAEKLEFHIFDVFLNDDTPYDGRLSWLLSLFDYTPLPMCKVVPTRKLNSHEQISVTHDQYANDGYEGIMVRLEPSTTPYICKRTNKLLKVKMMQDEEFPIVDITEGVGNRSGIAGRVICRMKTGEEFEAGLSGDFDYFKELLENKDKYIGKPATIQYQGLTVARGVPRFGVMKAVRDYE